MSEEAPSKTLARFIAQTEFADLPFDVIHESKRVLLDALGVGLASHFTERGKSAIAFARSMGGPPEASILGVGDAVSCMSAAFANGEMINDLDYDPLSQMGDRTPHVTPFTLPAPLAVAEREGASGEEVLLAVAVAHEVGARVVNAVRAERSWRGKEAQGPVSYGYSSAAFGGTAGVCSLLGFTPMQTAHALGLTGHMIPVPTAAKWRFMPHSPTHKYCLAGWQGMIAVTAATMVGYGYDSDPAILDGERGFWRMYGTRDACDWSSYTQGLGDAWNIVNVRYKRYPCCGMTHPHLDLFSDIIQEEGLTPDEITQVDLAGGPRDLFVPLRMNREIQTHLDAQFSNFYGVAAVAFGVRPREWQDPTTFRDPRLLRFMDRVSWTPDPLTPSTVSVAVHAKGRLFERTQRVDGHERSAKISDEALQDKFREITSKTLDTSRAQEVIDAIMTLDEMRDVRRLMNLLSSPTTR